MNAIETFLLNLFAFLFFSWVSVLQNSKEEALNTALGGDQLHLQDSGLQDLSQAIIAELRHMPGNEACADCGAPGQSVISEITTTESFFFPLPS